MKQKRFYSYALATSLLISSFGGLVNVSAATYQDAEEVKAQEHVSIMKMDASASDLFKFSTKSQSKWIPVYPQADGILEIGANVSVYDKDKKAVATILDTEDQQVFVPNVKKGEVYYLKLADQIKDEFVATICVKKDNVTPLQTNILYTQSGQDKNIYQEFKTDKRSSQSIYLKPSNYSNKNVTFYLQKKEKGVWKTITNRMIAVANDHKRVTFDTGLKKGEYRLVSNAATGQIYQIALQNQPVSNKYQTKKAKAQTIKKGKTVRNIYTTSEKAARWYKVKATKKQSIKISTNNNSGKLEVSIYKKGRKKVLKKLSFKGEQSKTYRVKKAKAQTIKKGKTVRNIYTTSEKAARWYKVKATKKQSIKISTNNNSGKLEVSIYKKGRKKVLKKLSFKGEQSKTYRVKKGTYYVKTAKSGAKMNGEYTIRCK